MLHTLDYTPPRDTCGGPRVCGTCFAKKRELNDGKIMKPAHVIAEDPNGEMIFHEDGYQEITNVIKDVPHGQIIFSLKGCNSPLTVTFTDELEVW